MAEYERPKRAQDAWLIWCEADHVWWRPDANGYTSYLVYAGAYTEDDAKRLAANRDFDHPKRLADILGDTPPPDGSVGYLLGVHRIVVPPGNEHGGTVVRRALLAEADGLLGHALHRNRGVFVDGEAVEGVIRELRWEYERSGKP